LDLFAEFKFVPVYKGAFMTDIALLLITPIILGFIIGRYLDNIFHLKIPWLTITFSLLGVMTGMWSIYKRYIR